MPKIRRSTRDTVTVVHGLGVAVGYHPARGTLGTVSYDTPPNPLVRAGTVGDAMAANVAVAILDSMGIEAHLKGEALGAALPVTVGKMAVTEIWVHHSDLDEARRVIADAEGRGRDPASTETDEVESVVEVPLFRLVALVTGAVLVLTVVISLMRLF
jgi:hypothetical protein